MEILETIGAWIAYVALALIFIFKKGTQKYVDEKAKNLATIEDTAKITDEIEGVKTQYQRQSHAWKWVFEKEYEILKDVWAKSWEFQSSARSLQPIMDSLPEGEEERKEVFEERYHLFIESMDAFKEAVFKNKPFIPPHVYEACMSMRTVVGTFRKDFELSFFMKAGGPDWKKLTEAIGTLNQSMDSLNEKIRTHIHQNAGMVELNEAQQDGAGNGD